jgi:hypothetical protein
MCIKLLGITSVDFNVTSTTDQIFYIWQTLKKKWEYNATVHQDFKTGYNSVRGKYHTVSSMILEYPGN